MWVFVPRAKGDDQNEQLRARADVSHSRRLSVALLVAVVVLVVMIALFLVGRSVGHVGPGLALLWLVYLIALAVVALRTPARRITIRRFFAVVFLSGLSVAVLALGAFFGFLASTGVPMSGGNGLHSWQPTSLATTQHHYKTEFGSTILDLSAVRFPSSGYDITASTAVGTLRVIVPSDTVVNISTHVGIGRVDYGFDSSASDLAAAFARSQLSIADAPDAPRLNLVAIVGVGHIVITRSTAHP
jgi:uncharacterized membrane protein YhaH (DUF805 family)